MSQRKNNQDLWGRLFFIVFGSGILVYGLMAIHKGYINLGRRPEYSHTYFAATEPAGFWFRDVLVLLLGALFVCIGIRIWDFWKPSRQGRKAEHKQKAERKEALRLGLTVSDVERDLPQFSRGNQSCELVRGSCVRYSLPRHGDGLRAAWSLLQRTSHEGAQLANGYLLQGEVSDALREALTKLTAEFTEDYYEFEGTPTEVAVYWEESGGVSEARHMHEILQSLAGL